MSAKTETICEVFMHHKKEPCTNTAERQVVHYNNSKTIKSKNMCCEHTFKFNKKLDSRIINIYKTEK